MGRLSESLLLVSAGALLGPGGLALLTPDAFAFLDPAMPVALVAFGILVGTSVSGSRSSGRRLTGAALADGGVTVAIVTMGMLLIVPVGLGTDPLPYALSAVILGICSVASSAGSLQPGGRAHSTSQRIGDFDAFITIVLGGAAMGFLRNAPPASALLLVLQSAGVALVIAVGAWLLLSQSDSVAEQRVFTGALLLLLGGAADYLGLSALLGGLIAGFFLDRVGGQARDAVRRDVLQFQRPLLVLVLIFTGARMSLTLPWLGVAVAYVLLRTTAKLIGAWIAARTAADAAPGEPGLHVLSPGIVGIALALNVLRAAGDDAAPLLAVVTVGTLGCEALARLATPREVKA
jgi:hypothetical protein